MGKPVDHSGEKYGMLTVLYDTGKFQFEGTKNQSHIYHCICECGNECDRSVIELKHRKSPNCGCLEDNKKKITQLRKALQDSIDKEIEAEKKRQREILAGNVSLENNILDVIKKRYQDEWDLQKKSIEKEKESLNEYKKLINERFN